MEILYYVDTTHVNEHLVEIKLIFTSPWDNPILEMPVWTPGSYKIRDYSKFVQELSATSQGNQIDNNKISKNQWQIHIQNGALVEVSYRVYTFELTVRTSYLDDRFGLLSPASLFFYISNGQEDTKSWKYNLQFKLLDNWKLFTSLKLDNSEYSAINFDELIDSPVGLAHPDAVETLNYEIDKGTGTSVTCTVALIGIPGNQDLNEFSEGLKKIQLKSIEMFGDLPYDRYLWALFVVNSGGGGLEHKYSNFSITSRWAFKGDKKSFARLMSLEAHEHFHTYNIKRIRPDNLGPFNYTKEVYSSLLWVAEGLTSHYDNLFLVRCGLIDEEKYWTIIASNYKKLKKNEGRKLVSLSQSSFNSWIKLYQPHEGLSNSYVSYYLKGGIVGLMLDLEIRSQTNWEKSLDDFFSNMYDEYKQNKIQGYKENEFQMCVEKYTNSDLSDFWNKYIDGTEAVDLDHYLIQIGLKIETETKNDVYVGWELNMKSLKIKSIHSNSPAMKAGISSRDEILAINNFKLSSSNYDKILKSFKAKDKAKIQFFRDGVLREVSIVFSDPIPEKYKIIEIEDQSEEQKIRRKAFLHQS